MIVQISMTRNELFLIKEMMPLWKKYADAFVFMDDCSTDGTSEWLEEHKEEFKLLADKIKELDTVRDCETLKDMQSRKHAINMVESWIEDIFGIKKELLTELSEEPDIYTLSEERSNSEK